MRRPQFLRSVGRRLLGGGWRKGIVAIALASALAAAAWLADDQVEIWMRDTLADVAATHLRPTLEFSDLHYDFPLGARLDGVALIAPDGTRVIEADSIELSLAELPSPSEPLVIEGVSVQSLTLRLHRRPEGGVVGLSDLFRQPPQDPSVTASDVFRLREVQIEDGELLYRGKPDAEYTRLDGLRAELDIAPQEVEADEPWYQVRLDSGRSDQIRVHGAASLSLDRKLVDIAALALEVNVDSATVASLPPPLRGLADDHRARGSFRGILWGRWNIAEPRDSALFTSMRLDESNLRFGDWRVHSRTLSLLLSLADQRVQLHDLSIHLLDGMAEAHGRLELAEGSEQLRLDWHIRDVNLRELLAAKSRRESDLAGRLSAHGHLELSLRDPPTVGGGGQLHVRNGRLLVVPALSALAEQIERDTAGRHEAAISFRLSPRSVRVTELMVDTPLFGVTGHGRVGYDGRLDLSVAAGPLQKMRGGPIREGLGKLGARVWSYHLGGTVNSPKLQPRPLSIGNSNPRQ